jgi:hypothetical protein
LASVGGGRRPQSAAGPDGEILSGRRRHGGVQCRGPLTPGSSHGCGRCDP